MSGIIILLVLFITIILLLYKPSLDRLFNGSVVLWYTDQLTGQRKSIFVYKKR